MVDNIKSYSDAIKVALKEARAFTYTPKNMKKGVDGKIAWSADSQEALRDAYFRVARDKVKLTADNWRDGTVQTELLEIFEKVAPMVILEKARKYNPTLLSPFPDDVILFQMGKLNNEDGRRRLLQDLLAESHFLRCISDLPQVSDDTGKKMRDYIYHRQAAGGRLQGVLLSTDESGLAQQQEEEEEDDDEEELVDYKERK